MKLAGILMVLSVIAHPRVHVEREHQEDTRPVVHTHTRPYAPARSSYPSSSRVWRPL